MGKFSDLLKSTFPFFFTEEAEKSDVEVEHTSKVMDFPEGTEKEDMDAVKTVTHPSVTAQKEKENDNQTDFHEWFHILKGNHPWNPDWKVSVCDSEGVLRMTFQLCTYWFTLGRYKPVGKDRFWVGSSEVTTNMIQLKGLSKQHGYFIYDDTVDSIGYVKSTLVNTKFDTIPSGKCIEIYDGAEFYIGDYLFQFQKLGKAE